MEWALFISRRQNMHLAADPWKMTSAGAGPATGRVVENLFGKVRFTRLYFGQEFCERALPTTSDLADAIGVSRHHKMAFTLVTPYVTESALIKLERLFEELREKAPSSEVVVNDWGALVLLRKKFPSLTPVLGRLLNKMWRDPRLQSAVPAEDIKLFRACGLAGPQMKGLMKLLNIRRVELDNLLQGMDDYIPRWGYQVTMYIPYGCITTGRACLFGSWGLPRAEKFKANLKNCSRLCGSYLLELSDLSNQVARKNRDWRIVQKGNTIFYEQQEGFLALGLAKAKDLHFSRIVYQPEPL